MENIQPEFLDGNEGIFSSNKEDMFSFRWISMGHLKKILSLGSVEFRGGFWQTKTITSGGTIRQEKIYVPDTREEYSNAIAALYDICLPHLDKTGKRETKYIIDKLDSSRKDCIDSTSIKENEILSNDSYVGKDKIIIEEYRFKKLRLYRELFQRLSCFLERIDYFASKGGVVDE